MKLLWILLIFLIWIFIEYCFLPINFHSWWHPKYYQRSVFNLPESKLSLEAQELINLGRVKASQKKIVIAGLARNIRKRLEFNIPILEQIGSKFQDYQIVIFENDSTDGTRDLIKSWSSQNKHVVLLDCCDLGDCDCQLKEKNLYDLGAMTQARIDKMAFFRNRYLEYIQTNLSDYDYMLVIDLDIEGSTNIDGIYHTIAHRNWDMVALNGRTQLPGTFGTLTNAYDALAYRSINEIKATENINFGNWFQKWWQMNRLITSSGEKMVPVKSAFNGAGLYQIKSILGTKYYTLSNSEHIGLHQSMSDANHGAIFINPLWLGYMGYQGPRGNLGSFWKSIVSN